MKMLARIAAPETLLDRLDHGVIAEAPSASVIALELVETRVSQLRAPPARAVYRPAAALANQATDEAAFTLLDREERLAILLSRRGSRFAALAGGWLAAIERILPAVSPEAATARERAARLAALRRYAILYRLDRSGLDLAEDDRLAAAGYSDAQADVVRALVKRFDAPLPAPAWKRVTALFALAIGGTYLLDRWLDSGIDDFYVSLLLSIVMACGVASFLSISAHPRGGSVR